MRMSLAILARSASLVLTGLVAGLSLSHARHREGAATGRSVGSAERRPTPSLVSDSSVVRCSAANSPNGLASREAPGRLCDRTFDLSG